MPSKDNLEIYVEKYSAYKKDNDLLREWLDSYNYLLDNDIYTYEQLNVVEALVDYGCNVDKIREVLEAL